jgi:hypothetical protein
VQLWVTDLDPSLARQLDAATMVGNLAFALLIFSITVPAFLHLLGRLRWSVLSWTLMGGGIMMVLGTLVSGLISGLASESFSMELPDAPVWFEPGSFVGIDFGSVVLGMLFVILGVAFRRTSKFAGDADKVV